MALKDNLKHFKDFDGYSGSLTKSDFDNNIDTLADAIDDVPITYDDTQIKAKDTSLGLGIAGGNASGNTAFAFGNSCVASASRAFAYGDSCEASGDTSFAYGSNCKASEELAFAYGDSCEADDKFAFAYGESCQSSGSESFAFGKNCIASGDKSFAFGEGCEASANFSSAWGYKAKSTEVGANLWGAGVTNKQPTSVSYGGYDGKASAMQVLTHINSTTTTDDTQKDFDYPINLFIKGLFYIKITGMAYKDDYSTKWIFERTLIVRTDADGKITIDKDDNNDIVKDDSDWKFDISSTDDSETPYLTLSVTGKADTNIIWNFTLINHMCYVGA